MLLALLALEVAILKAAFVPLYLASISWINSIYNIRRYRACKCNKIKGPDVLLLNIAR
jgi:hypothetical protein